MVASKKPGPHPEHPKDTMIRVRVDKITLKELDESAQALDITIRGHPKGYSSGIQRPQKMKGSGSPLVKAVATSSTANAKGIFSITIHAQSFPMRKMALPPRGRRRFAPTGIFPMLPSFKA